MAVDKLVDSTQLDADLTSVANAIRTKGGTSASLAFPSEFVSAIQSIPSGGGGMPSGYEQYETLAVNSAPLLTDYIPVQGDSIDFLGKLSIANGSYWVFTSGDAGNRFALLLQPNNSNGNLNVRNLVSTNTSVTGLLFSDKPFIVKLRPSSVYFNESLIVSVQQDVANGEKFLIGGHPDGTNPYRGIIYYIAVRRNGETIHYYVPCVRTSDNASGLFDLITETFYTSSSGTLIAEGKILPNSVALSALLGG